MAHPMFLDTLGKARYAATREALHGVVVLGPIGIGALGRRNGNARRVLHPLLWIGGADCRRARRDGTAEHALAAVAAVFRPIHYLAVPVP